MRKGYGFELGVGYTGGYFGKFLMDAWTPFFLLLYTISRHIIAKIMFISLTKMSAGH